MRRTPHQISVPHFGLRHTLQARRGPAGGPQTAAAAHIRTLQGKRPHQPVARKAARAAGSGRPHRSSAAGTATELRESDNGAKAQLVEMIRHQADTRPRNRADRPQLRGKLVDSWDDRREGPVALAAARTANAAQSGPFSLSATTSHVRGQPGRGGRTVRRTAVVGFWLAAAACHTRGSCIPLGAMVWYYLAPLWIPHKCCKGGAGPTRQRRRP